MVRGEVGAGGRRDPDQHFGRGMPVIRYHGVAGMKLGAITKMLIARHGLVSHARPESLPIVAELCQSFALDNGAFSVWRSGKQMDVAGYADWVRHWMRHPGFDWCLIPDVIDGDGPANDEMLDAWPLPKFISV